LFVIKRKTATKGMIGEENRERKTTMKRASLILVMGMLLVGFHVVACGDDESEEKSGGDGDGDSDVDGGGDEDTGTGEEDNDTGTGEGSCGELSTQCCEDGDECGEGLSSSISIMDQICYCLPPCTFNTCTAGSEEGYCSWLAGPDINTCVNDVDFQADPIECTDGDTCTTPSGVEDGICITMIGPDFTTMVNRCVALCDNPPAECDDPLVCNPEITIDNGELNLDYANGHCSTPLG
jgi:hypothetical protein